MTPDGPLITEGATGWLSYAVLRELNPSLPIEPGSDRADDFNSLSQDEGENFD